MADFLSALQTYLGNQTGETVYAIIIPRNQVEQMPDRFILVRPAGGGQVFHNSYMPTGDQRVMVSCYDQNRDIGHSNAMRMWRDVNTALKHNLQQQKVDDLILYWAKPAGGPLPQNDPDTGWPSVMSTWQIYSEDAK